MEPERVLVRDLIEPLGVSRAGVDQSRQAKGRQEEHLAFCPVDVFPVHMALDVARHGMLRPLSLFERLRKKLELGGRRWKAGGRYSVDLNSDGVSAFRNYFAHR